MLRVAEQYSTTDTGLQRRANEDSLLARSPLFVVADGMGGAQAGEVASRIAVESFQQGLGDTAQPEQGLAEQALVANTRIHELSHSNAEHAGMGTTLTAVYVGPSEVSVAHVGDSRAYCLRDGELTRLTNDHSLVDELVRQGKITPEEAIDHPQRSVITRALGPEPVVEIDTFSFQARAGDVYLICSDGLTTMVPEPAIAELLRAHAQLRDAGEALIAAANQAGGRDNITVVLFRLGDTTPEALGAGPDTAPAEVPPSSAAGPVEPAGPSEADGDLGGASALEAAPGAQGAGVAATVATAAVASAPPVSRRAPRMPAPEEAAARRSGSNLRRAWTAVIVLTVLAVIGAGAYLAFQSVYFIGTNNRGLVTLYEGLPYQLPGGINLYSSTYVSGVSASSLTPSRRRTVLNHSLRSESNAGELLHSLELGQLNE